MEQIFESKVESFHYLQETKLLKENPKETTKKTLNCRINERGNVAILQNFMSI